MFRLLYAVQMRILKKLAQSNHELREHVRKLENELACVQRQELSLARVRALAEDALLRGEPGIRSKLVALDKIIREIDAR